MKNIAITKGYYTRDFYILPTILIHQGDCYKTIEVGSNVIFEELVRPQIIIYIAKEED